MYLGPCKAEPQSLHIMLHGLGQGRAEGDFLSDAPFFDLLSKCFSSAHAQMGGVVPLASRIEQPDLLWKS